MGLRINTNIPSIGAQRALRQTGDRLNANLRKLSSGQRITRAGDDAAGLAISENLRADIRSMRQAKRNANDGISLIQTAEGSLGEISNMLIRLRELSIQAASDTVGDTERGFTDIEFQNLKEEIERITKSTQFNGIQLLDGTGGMLEFQIGISNDPFLDRIGYDGVQSDATLQTLGIDGDSIANKIGAQSSLRKLDDALVKVNAIRANMGALQNRLTSTVNNLGISDENLSAANSRIRDVDVASESSDLTRNTILQQAGTSVLSQANQSPQAALKLIS